MKSLFIVVLFCLIPTSGFADQITPKRTVIEAIRAAQMDNREKLLNIVDFKKVSTRKRHSFSEKKLIKLFKSIDLKKATFKESKSIKKVHMTAPLNFQFEMKVINRKNVHPRVIYKIIGVYP